MTDWNNAKTVFGYDDDGDLATTTYPDGVVATDAYFDDGTAESATAAKGSTTLASVVYTRGNAGQVRTATPTGLPDAAQTDGYTTLEQLQPATSASGTTAYAYSAAGNPTTAGGNAQAFDAASQLCEEAGASAVAFGSYATSTVGLAIGGLDPASLIAGNTIALRKLWAMYGGLYYGANVCGV